MKAPQPETPVDTVIFSNIVMQEVPWSEIRMWGAESLLEAHYNGTLQELIDNDWEHIWSHEECQRIMSEWVAYRISR